MSKVLVIGDVHAVPNELVDCEALWRLVCETVEKEITPVVQNGVEYFVVSDDHGNCVIVQASIAILGLETIAKAKGVELSAYVGEICKKEDKEEPKLEEKKECP